MLANSVIVIDDDPAILEMYRFKLELGGFSVKTARNGREGLSLVQTHPPDIILLDLKMPVMNGEEMLQQLRSKSWGSSIRVIVLTNISRDEAPSMLRLLAVDRYVVKAHHTPTQVLEIVKEVLGIQ